MNAEAKLQAFIAKFGLARYAQQFAEHQIGLGQIVDCTSENLKEVGISNVQDRIKLLAEALKLKKFGDTYNHEIDAYNHENDALQHQIDALQDENYEIDLQDEIDTQDALDPYLLGSAQSEFEILAEAQQQNFPTELNQQKLPTETRQLQEFFGQRPSSELIANDLQTYFPVHDSNVLQSTVRRSIRYSLADPKRFSTTSNTSIGQILSNRAQYKVSYRHESIKEPLQETDKQETDLTKDSNLKDSVLSTTQQISWLKGAMIGSGSFGKVFLGMNATNGEIMAVKTLGMSAEKESVTKMLQHEIKLLQEFQHENIVRYIGSQTETDVLCIFLEYVPGGSVSSLLNMYGPFEERLIQTFVKQILHGLDYLHRRDVVHRDIKGANVLVDNKGVIKISDFGISKKLDTSILNMPISCVQKSNRVSLQGSIFWLAPEVVKQAANTSKSDIWSLACLIIEMLTAKHPFAELNQIQAIFKVSTLF